MGRVEDKCSKLVASWAPRKYKQKDGYDCDMRRVEAGWEGGCAASLSSGHGGCFEAVDALWPEAERGAEGQGEGGSEPCLSGLPSLSLLSLELPTIDSSQKGAMRRRHHFSFALGGRATVLRDATTAQDPAGDSSLRLSKPQGPIQQPPSGAG